MYLLPYIKYLTEARHWRGHGIHSPFAFDLAHNVIPGKHTYYAFASLHRLVGGQTGRERKRRELLFRLLNTAPVVRHVLVVGGSAADAMYLASVNTAAVCLFISPAAKEDFFRQKGFNNIRVVSLQEALQFPAPDFVFFAGALEGEVAACLQHIRQETVFAFSHTYTQNARNWAFISAQPQVRLSIRTFALGLVYFNHEVQPGSYTLLN